VNLPTSGSDAPLVFQKAGCQVNNVTQFNNIIYCILWTYQSCQFSSLFLSRGCVILLTLQRGELRPDLPKLFQANSEPLTRSPDCYTFWGNGSLPIFLPLHTLLTNSGIQGVLPAYPGLPRLLPCL
jgi:hypothetical protein